MWYQWANAGARSCHQREHTCSPYIASARSAWYHRESTILDTIIHVLKKPCGILTLEAMMRAVMDINAGPIMFYSRKGGG